MRKLHGDDNHPPGLQTPGAAHTQPWWNANDSGPDEHLCGRRRLEGPSSGGVRAVEHSQAGLSANYHISHISVSVFVVAAKQTDFKKTKQKKRVSGIKDACF